MVLLGCVCSVDKFGTGFTRPYTQLHTQLPGKRRVLLVRSISSDTGSEKYLCNAVICLSFSIFHSNPGSAGFLRGYHTFLPSPILSLIHIPGKFFERVPLLLSILFCNTSNTPPNILSESFFFVSNLGSLSIRISNKVMGSLKPFNIIRSIKR